MLSIDVPGAETLLLEHLVLDYNSTLAVHGELVPGAAARLHTLSTRLRIHVVTADTFGRAGTELAGLPCTLCVLPPQGQDARKLGYVRGLGAERVVCIGNGRNDRSMVEAAALGIAVIQEEGAAVETVLAADVVVRNITDALDLLVQPLRLAATLRR